MQIVVDPHAANQAHMRSLHQCSALHIYTRQQCMHHSNFNKKRQWEIPNGEGRILVA